MTTNLNIEAARVRAKADAIVVEHPRLRMAHEQFEFLMEHGRRRPGQSKMGALMVAPTQSGKSTIISSWANLLNTPEMEERRQIPVLHVTLSANVTCKGLAINILEAFEDRGIATGALSRGQTEAVLLARAQNHIRNAGVQLLILDEFQHVIHSESHRLVHSVGEFIKRMLITGCCPIVLSGIEDARRPFESNAQLRQRCLPPIELKPLRITDPADAALFTDFIETYAAELEHQGLVRDLKAIADNDLNMICLLDVSDGVLGVACNLIKDALQIAIKRGSQTVLVGDLEAATDRLIASGCCDHNAFRHGPRALSPRAA
ncbi:TniB family NTP-binding protein [Brevundimonas sp.]|jgi:hypothetical protein|uniref:TniB family NTP-binding protein n=1 Tax=Brevundimonas sp. TaxID=1871086 RepID=UPI0025BD3BD6|nr:TniB family NTP-binding protein [Brevundimonas sp.]MCG2664720.1 TniB family NTP-binding protein [Brevundimonas sp.]